MAAPNILIFMTDQQRADVCFPEHPCKTPNLDKFGEESLWFREAYCPTSHCCPSRATFMTGHYPSRHGVWNNVCNDQAISTGLNPGIRCWSEDLREHGYDLHYFGKWHVSAEERPSDRGWTEHSVRAVPGDRMGLRYGEYRNLPISDGKQRQAGEIQGAGYPKVKLYGKITTNEVPDDERIIEEAVETLSGKNSGVPWCMYVGTFGPHDPFLVPQKYLEMYQDVDVPLPESWQDDLRDKPNIYRRIREVFRDWSEEEYREARRHYWAYCTWMDALFGKLLEALESSGQADNTIVLYCSDHGEYCGDHGLFCKGIAAFREAYHVPAVLRWPNRLQRPGEKEEALVSLADFAPTFLEAAGIEPARDLAGQSLIPHLQTPDIRIPWRETMHTQCDGVELYYTQRAVWSKDWKYVFNGFDFDELYDLQKDPHEMKNLINDPQYEEIKEDLVRRHWRFAENQHDGANNDYLTVRLFPRGPGMS